MTVFGVVASVAALVGLAAAKEAHGRLGCTAIAVDGAATKDGSAFAGMNADCSDCDGRLAWIAPAEHPEGALRGTYINFGKAPRWVGHGRGEFYEPKNGENVSVALGYIPQVRKTFGYWEAVLPLMNDQGLAFGESSCAAMLVNSPFGRSPEDGHVGALLDITTLMELALERCATARCAVELMGALAEEHGFFPMAGEWSPGLPGTGYDDAGEALTVADTTGEVWVFHVVGGVPGRQAKSVWAAQRLPKGHMAVIANNFIILEVPETPTEDFLFSADLRGTAEAAGLWSPQAGAFNFARVYAPNTVTFQDLGGGAPIPLYASLRQWRLFSIAAPSLHLPLDIDPLNYPMSVRVEAPIDHNDAQNLLRDMYSGTEFDLTKGVLAGPFGNPFGNMVEGGALGRYGQRPRGISIQRTVYGVVGQPGRGNAAPLFWYAADAPVTSVFVPYYPGAGHAQHPAYGTGTNKRFTRESAWWAFDFVNNWMQINYRNMSMEVVYPLMQELQDRMDVSRAELEARSPSWAERAAWQTDTQGTVVRRWWALADELIMRYNDNFWNGEAAAGLSIGYPPEFLEMIGLDQDVHPIYVKRTAPPTPEANPMPHIWDNAHGAWLFGMTNLAGFLQGAPGARAEGNSMLGASAIFCIALCAAVSAGAGVALGRRWERAVRVSDAGYSKM